MSPGRGPWPHARAFLDTFLADLEVRLPLPEASAEEQAAHAAQVEQLQEMLALLAATPGAGAGEVEALTGRFVRLWRLLYQKGDEIDRAVSAQGWRAVLHRAGDRQGFAFATSVAAASERNFFRLPQALALCEEAREMAGETPSAALVTVLNVEGITRLCMDDFDGAEPVFRRVLGLARSVDEEELLALTGLTRQDLVANESLNLIECDLRRGYASAGAVRARCAASARQGLDAFDHLRCSEGFRNMGLHDRAELAILEGRLDEARAQLVGDFDTEAQDGPHQYALSPMQLRLLAHIATLRGEWKEAYRWTRMALKQVVRRSYPTEEQAILRQALVVITELRRAEAPGVHDAVVDDLAQLMEDKDWYTGRPHSRSVSALAVRLGEALRERAGWAVDGGLLRDAGLLHDIGKISIPWSLLNKIAPIGRAERALLEEHSARGSVLLETIGMRDVAAVVRQHHEHADGSGYPDRVAPAAAAAIIAVSDVFEATITASRGYKTPKSPAQALVELRQGAGPKHDPEVVEALAHVVG